MNGGDGKIVRSLDRARLDVDLCNIIKIIKMMNDVVTADWKFARGGRGVEGTLVGGGAPRPRWV